MPPIGWLLLGLAILAGSTLGVAIGLYGNWRNAVRERDVFVELHRIASRDLNALLAGAPVHIVNVCRECKRQLKP